MIMIRRTAAKITTKIDNEVMGRCWCLPADGVSIAFPGRFTETAKFEMKFQSGASIYYIPLPCPKSSAVWASQRSHCLVAMGGGNSGVFLEKDSEVVFLVLSEFLKEIFIKLAAYLSFSPSRTSGNEIVLFARKLFGWRINMDSRNRCGS